MQIAMEIYSFYHSFLSFAVKKCNGAHVILSCLSGFLGDAAQYDKIEWIKPLQYFVRHWWGIL